MPVWAGWLMMAIGCTVGWIIGHQLGVQHEARRIWRDTQVVLHPHPDTRPTLWMPDKPEKEDVLKIGMWVAADLFAASMSHFMAVPISDKPEKDGWVSKYSDEEIDQNFLAALQYGAETWAIGYLINEHTLPEQHLDFIIEGASLACEDELSEIAQLIAYRIRSQYPQLH